MGRPENMLLLGSKSSFISNPIVFLIIIERINGKRMVPNQSALYANNNTEGGIASSNIGQYIVFR